MHTASSTQTPSPTAPGILDVVQVAKAIGDPLRANVLRVLARDSFAVQELGDVFAMSQPAMSHHLKILAAAGLVTKRREGTTIFYQRAFYPSAEGADGAWVAGLFTAIDAEAPDADLIRKIAGIHKVRQQRSLDFFANQADALAQQTALICDPSVYAPTVLSALSGESKSHGGAALEVGPGSGTLLTELAGLYQQVVGVDMAGQMLDRARLAVEAHDNVRLVERDFNELPAIRKYDAVVAAMVLHHMPSPSAFFSQVSRVLKANGRLIVAELCDHSFDWVKPLCGDVWLGFAPDQLNRWAAEAGFTSTHHQFLAQRNGFRVQVAAFVLNLKHQRTGNPHV